MSRPIITIPVGTPGAQGPAGQDGNTILYGSVDPTTEGMNGDFYINTTTNYIFGPKAGNIWPAGESLIGTQGSQGVQGTPGVDGQTVLYGMVNPTTEGDNGDFYINTATYFIFGPKTGGVWPAGTSLVGPSGSAADHETLTNLQGGSVSFHYHSNQPINDTDNVIFKTVCVGPMTPALNAQVEINENAYIGTGTISTVGLSATITTTGNAFALANIDSGSSITANGNTVTVNDVLDANTVTVFPDINLSTGYAWTYKNPTRVAINRDADDKTSTGVAFYSNNELTWEQYVWAQDGSKFFYPAWNERAYVDNMIIHENGRIAIGGMPFEQTGYREPDASLEIYCHPFNLVLGYDGSTYTDNTLEAQSSNSTSFTLLADTNDISYLGKYTNFSSIYFNLVGVASSCTPVFEYWNGVVWTTLTVTADSTSNFTQTGSVIFTVPANWANTTVNTSDSMYFIRVRASALSGNISIGSVIPMGGGRFSAYKSPLDTAPVFSIDADGRTAIGKAAANAQLDVVTSLRVSGETSGHFQLNVPDGGQSVSLNVPTTAPATGKLLGLSSSSQLAWLDNSLITYFGDGSDGDLTVSSGTTTLARDTFYDNVTISGTATIDCAGYRLHVKGNLNLSNAGASAINRNGAAGQVGNGTSSGTAGGTRANQTLGGCVAATAGTAGTTGAGTQATAGTSANPGQGGASGAGGKGGNNTSVPNAGGASRIGTGTTGSSTIANLKTDFLRGVTLMLGGASAPGGSSGGGDGTNSGRGGGGGGSAGAIIAIYANTITTSGSTAAGAIASLGGNGGAGGPNSTGNVGGGGGGGGAGGGFIYVMYNTKIGAAVTGLISATGGTGGNGSNGAGTGVGGDGGAGGASGRITVINTATGVIFHAIGGAGSAGTAGSGITGGPGGSGGIQTYTL